MAKDAKQVSRELFKQVDAIRQAKGLSWGKLAKEIGSSPGTMTRFIAGETLSLQSYLRLAEFVVEARGSIEVSEDLFNDALDNGHVVPVGLREDGAILFKDYSPEEREKMADSGEAMPDGSYPIADCEDLSNAIQAIGRAKDPDATKAHIKKRAGALDCPDVELPEDWADEPEAVEEEDEEFSGEFTVTGDTTMPVGDRDYDWDGLAAKDRIFDKYSIGEGKVDVDAVSKCFLRRDPKMDPNLKGAWALGFADIVGGTPTIIPSGVAAVAGGHGIGKMKGLQTDELQQLKNACCDLYSTVAKKYEDWPACPFERDNRNDKQVDIEGDGENESEVIAASADFDFATGFPVEGIMAVEGTPSGDGRMLERGSVKWDEDVLPIALIWDRQEGDHTGMTVGSINEVWREGDEIWGKGFLSNSEDPETRAAVRRVAELLNEGAVGVSIALDHVDVELRVKKSALEARDEMPDLNDLEEDENGYAVLGRMMSDEAIEVTTSGNLRHLAIVDTAALTKGESGRVKLRLVDPLPEEVVEVAASGTLRIVEFDADPEAFHDPRFGAPGNDDRLLFDPHNNRWSCPVTVTDDGRVYGHIAPWGICLRGRPDRCITPPNADLGGFMRGRAPLAGGQMTGVICVGASHSATGIGAEAATKHYDKTGRAVADVRVGMDAYGIWFAGRLRPGAHPDDIYAFKASDVSGHWEVGKNGQMTLCGLPAVNIGGFPKGYMTAEEVAMAASATLQDEDCGCDGPEDEVLEVDEAQGVLFSEERFVALEAAVARIAEAVAPLYAEHLAKSLPDDVE